MLFLAVFCGFLAENLRENRVEKNRAKQYASLLIEDLSADTAELNTAIHTTERVILTADSLMAELNKPISIRNDSIMQITNWRMWAYDFYDPQLGAYNQVKNSGSLRYFSKEIVRMLDFYETRSNMILKVSDKALDFRNNQLVPLILKIANARFIRSWRKETTYTGPVFIEKPERKLEEEWYASVYYTKRTYTSIVSEMKDHLKEAVELMELLKKEYHSE